MDVTTNPKLFGIGCEYSISSRTVPVTLSFLRSREWRPCAVGHEDAEEGEDELGAQRIHLRHPAQQRRYHVNLR